MMINEQSNIEQVVMQRVRRIALLRLFISLAVASCVLFAAALWGIGREVWVARVFENMPHGDPVAFSQFMLAAFGHTNFLVQLCTLIAVVSLVYLARATAQALTLALTPTRA